MVTVFWRFALSTLIMFAYLKWSKQSLNFDGRTHAWFALQGILNFSINYMLTYWSETFIKSGVLAIMFTTMVYFNILFSWLFFKRAISARVTMGSVFGGVGIFLIFKDDLLNTSSANDLFGLMLGLLAPLSASLGNMAYVRNIQKGITIGAANSFSMFYGTVFTGLTALILGVQWSFPTTPSFVGSLLYLSVFGTVIAFAAYNTLLKTIGPEKAVYTTIISPIFAIIISYFFEDLKLGPAMVIGVVLCLVGNVLVLYKPKFSVSK